MIWVIIGIIIAIILGCTAFVFHQKQRRHGWVFTVLAIIALAGSGLYARHEIVSHNSEPRTTQQAKRRPAKANRNNVNNRNVRSQNKKPASKNQKQQPQKKQSKPVNSKWAQLKHKIIRFAVIAAIMALLAGAVIED